VVVQSSDRRVLSAVPVQWVCKCRVRGEGDKATEKISQAKVGEAEREESVFCFGVVGVQYARYSICAYMLPSITVPHTHTHTHTLSGTLSGSSEYVSLIIVMEFSLLSHFPARNGTNVVHCNVATAS
jgi:hypothetical protein